LIIFDRPGHSVLTLRAMVCDKRIVMSPAAVVPALREWVKAARPTATFVIEGELGDVEAEAVCLQLFRIEREGVMRNGKLPPLVVKLTYLVTVRANNADGAAEVLADLAFGAMEHPELLLESGRFDPGMWQALGLRPQGALLVAVKAMRERPVKQVPIVRGGVEMRSAPLVTFAGRVLTPNGRPLPGVEVALPDISRRATSDVDGQFALHGLMQPPKPKSLRLSKGGLPLKFSAAVSPQDGTTMFTLKEPANHA